MLERSASSIETVPTTCGMHHNTFHMMLEKSANVRSKISLIEVCLLHLNLLCCGKLGPTWNLSLTEGLVIWIVGPAIFRRLCACLLDPMASRPNWRTSQTSMWLIVG